MHGIIFSNLKKYVESAYNNGTWDKLMHESGTGREMYLMSKDYPDEDMYNLISTASKVLARPAADILEDFGTFIIPVLIKEYSLLIKKEWKTIDFIENTEETIHKIVRRRNPGAKPPVLKCKRSDRNEVTMTYFSERKMCDFLKGMVKGLADYYNEEISVSHTRCMSHGHSACTLTIMLRS
jgi:predicted hydrocarbon binding protein